MSKLKQLLKIFFIFFKIGLFTFGGGYAMVAIIEREIVENRNWLNHDEFMDLIGIAESTPGPLAVNSATYVGYKVGGVFGSVFATLGVVLPSFIIIFVISFFLEGFLQLTWVKYAFNGIRACVAFLIVNAGIKMLKHLKLNWFNAVLFSLTLIGMVVLDFFAMNVSTIIYILLGGILGVAFLLSFYMKKNKASKTNKEEENK